MSTRTPRCATCHERCGPTEGVACQECGGRHHAGCWMEASTCRGCGSDRHLELPEARSVGGPTWIERWALLR